MAKHESKDDEHAASAEAPAEEPGADSTNWVMLSIAGGAALLFFLTMPEPGAHEHSHGSDTHEAAHGAATPQHAEPSVGDDSEDTTELAGELDELDEQYAELAEDDGTVEEEEEEEEEAPPEKEEEKEEEKEAAPPPAPKPAVAPPAPRPVAPRPAPKPAPPAAPKPAAPPPPAPVDQPSGDNPY